MNDYLITTETSRLLKSNSSTRFRAYENEIWEIPDAISNTVQQYHQLTKLANTFQTINLTIVIRTRFNGEENFARPLVLHVLIKNWEIILISAPFCWKYLTLENLHRSIRFLSLAIIWKMILFLPLISRLNRWNFRTLRTKKLRGWIRNLINSIDEREKGSELITWNFTIQFRDACLLKHRACLFRNWLQIPRMLGWIHIPIVAYAYTIRLNYYRFVADASLLRLPRHILSFNVVFLSGFLICALWRNMYFTPMKMKNIFIYRVIRLVWLWEYFRVVFIDLLSHRVCTYEYYLNIKKNQCIWSFSLRIIHGHETERNLSLSKITSVCYI